MVRRGAELKALQDESVRQDAFIRRKNVLMRRCMELACLCGVDVFFFAVDPASKLHVFSSIPESDELLERYAGACGQPHERRTAEELLRHYYGSATAEEGESSEAEAVHVSKKARMEPGGRLHSVREEKSQVDGVSKTHWDSTPFGAAAAPAHVSTGLGLGLAQARATVQVEGLRPPGFLDKSNFPVSPRSEQAYESITADFERLCEASNHQRQQAGPGPGSTAAANTTPNPTRFKPLSIVVPDNSTAAIAMLAKSHHGGSVLAGAPGAGSMSMHPQPNGYHQQQQQPSGDGGVGLAAGLTPSAAAPLASPSTSSALLIPPHDAAGGLLSGQHHAGSSNALAAMLGGGGAGGGPGSSSIGGGLGGILDLGLPTPDSSLQVLMGTMGGHQSSGADGGGPGGLSWPSPRTSSAGVSQLSAGLMGGGFSDEGEGGEELSDSALVVTGKSLAKLPHAAEAAGLQHAGGDAADDAARPAGDAAEADTMDGTGDAAQSQLHAATGASSHNQRVAMEIPLDT